MIASSFCWSLDSVWSLFECEEDQSSNFVLRIAQTASLDYQVERFAGVAGSQVFRYEGMSFWPTGISAFVTLLPLRDPYNFLVSQTMCSIPTPCAGRWSSSTALPLRTRAGGCCSWAPPALAKPPKRKRWAEFRALPLSMGTWALSSAGNRTILPGATPWHGSSPTASTPLCR